MAPIHRKTRDLSPMVFKQVRSLTLEIRIVRRFTMLAVLALAFALVPMASASDELYRCSDGTFTNRVERQCPPYESKGIVRVDRTLRRIEKHGEQ
jgi:hypothetical protein